MLTKSDESKGENICRKKDRLNAPIVTKQLFITLTDMLHLDSNVINAKT